MQSTTNTRIYLICALLATGQFTLNTSVWMLTGLLAPLAQQFGVTVGAAGQVISVFTLSYALGAPLLTIAFTRVDRSKLLISALAVSSIANLLAAVAPDFGALLLFRGIAGAADGLYGATATAAALALAPSDKRGRFLALLNTGLTLAMFIGVPLTTLLGSIYGWRAPFLAIALFAGLSAVALYFLLPRMTTSASAPAERRFAIFKAQGAIPALLIGTLSYLGMFTVYAFIAPILHASAGISATGMSSMLLAFGLAAVVGNWLGGQAADRWGEARTLGFSLALVTPLLAALPFLAITPFFASVLLFIWGLIHYMGISPLQLLIARLVPDHTSIAVAMMNSFIYGGVALGAALGGLIFDHFPLVALGAAGAAFKLVALGLLIYLNRSVSRVPRQTGRDFA